MRLTSIVHILSPETDNCPSCIIGRERMTVENISWSISTKECCRPRRGLNPRPPGLQSDGASNWATEAGPLSPWICLDKAPDKVIFFSTKNWCLPHLSMKLLFWLLIRSASVRRFYWVPTTYVFYGEIRKIFFWYPLLSGAMLWS